MTDTTTQQHPEAHQLYPQHRLDNMSTDRLNAVLHLALYDMDETHPGLLYDGMDRASTVATAQRTRHDIANELRTRATRWATGQNS
jgi:hypothetical protein